jgi:hypothetical protein
MVTDFLLDYAFDIYTLFAAFLYAMTIIIYEKMKYPKIVRLTCLFFLLLLNTVHYFSSAYKYFIAPQ